MRTNNLTGPIGLKIIKELMQNGVSLHAMNFNVYDQIAARYGDCQPRCGVIFQSPIRLVEVWQGQHTRYQTVSIDTYGRGDIGNICYAAEFASKHNARNITKQSYWNRPMPFPANIALIIKGLRSARHVVLGVDNDPFSWMDRKYKITQETLNQIAQCDLIETLTIHTRSDLVAIDEYLALLLALVNRNVNVKVIVHRPMIDGEIDNEHLTQILEPGCASLKRRNAAVTRLNESGISAEFQNDVVDRTEKSVIRELGVFPEQLLTEMKFQDMGEKVS